MKIQKRCQINTIFYKGHREGKKRVEGWMDCKQKQRGSMGYTRFFTGLIERGDNASDSCWLITFPSFLLMLQLIAAGTLTMLKDIVFL